MANTANSPTAGLLIAGKFSLPHGVTDRFAEVTYLDSHSDALCYLGADGRVIRGELVSWREMTDAEVDEFESYGKEDARSALIVQTAALLCFALRCMPRVVETTGSEAA